jgi:hypothetical protein
LRGAAVIGHRIAIIAVLASGDQHSVAANTDRAVVAAEIDVDRVTIIATLALLDHTIAATRQATVIATAVVSDRIAVIAALDPRLNETVTAAR